MFSAWGLLVALLAASVQVDDGIHGNKIPLNYRINSTFRDTLN